MTPLLITPGMRSKNLLTAAKAYAKAGIPVLALWGVDADGACLCRKPNCTSAGKHPIAQMYPFGFKNASTELAGIGRVWKAYPEANIGLVIDKNLFVIDLDAKGNTQAGRELASYHLPLTATVRTSRGKHLYYMWQGEGRPPRIKKVDYRHSEKGYVVAPPSRHASGTQYRWCGPSEVATIPPSFFTTTCWSGKGNAAISETTGYFDPDEHEAVAVVKKYQRHYSHNVGRLMMRDRMLSPNRSKQIFLIAKSLFEAGASDDEVAAVVWRSPYFLDKWGEDYQRLNEELTRIKDAVERGRN